MVYPMYANPKTVKRGNTAKPHANSLMPIDENTEIYSGDCKRSRNSWFKLNLNDVLSVVTFNMPTNLHNFLCSKIIPFRHI